MIETEAQMYTDCTFCEWFGIPIVDDGAPDKCNKCLLEELQNYWRYLEIETDDHEIAKIYECINETLEDLKYYHERQDWLAPSERRFNTTRTEAK